MNTIWVTWVTWVAWVAWVTWVAWVYWVTSYELRVASYQVQGQRIKKIDTLKRKG